MQKTLIDSIDSFFTELNEEGIEYAILEKNQPNFINKTEIDIILNSKKDLFNLKKRYYHIYNQHGLFFVLLKKDLKEYKRIHINGVFKTLNRIKLRDKYFINYNHYYKSKNESNFRHVFFLIKRIIYGNGIIISLFTRESS